MTIDHIHRYNVERLELNIEITDLIIKVMCLEVMSIKNHGDADEEVVTLKVLQSCNLLGYAIVDTTFNSDGEQSNIHRHIFLFPRFTVKEGDYVKLFTTHGDIESVPNKAKTKTRKFYWNSDASIWNDSCDTAYLIKYTRISSKSI